MATTFGSLNTTAPSGQARQGEAMHKLLLTSATLVSAGLILYLAVSGCAYYRLSVEDRPFSPMHPQLRPSGTVGLRLGFLGILLFAVLFLYPLRKHWKWLGGIGVTRHWFDFHTLAGILVQLVITFHAAFKAQGIAGLAYWIMLAVALSGFVGRYVYSKIPRGLNSVQLTMSEIEARTADLTRALHEQGIFTADDLAPLLDVPAAGQIRGLGIAGILRTMLSKDLARPFLVARLRRRVLTPSKRLTTLGGLLSSHDSNIESIVANVRRQSRMRNGMAFLDCTERVFHLWHVIHRPFSYSLVILAAIHIGAVWSVGLKLGL
jgi:hypothetical protein